MHGLFCHIKILLPVLLTTPVVMTRLRVSKNRHFSQLFLSLDTDYITAGCKHAVD